jgi:hypothetical protein
MAGQLGSWYIEVVTKGKATVLSDVQEVRLAMSKVDTEHKKQTDDQKKRVNTLGAVWQRVGVMMQTAGQHMRMGLIAASAAMVGFARAGLSGTTHGAALSLRFQMLSREITQLFLPAIEGGIMVIGKLVQWFRRMDGQAQAAAGAILGIGVALKVALLGHPIMALVVGMASFVLSTKEGHELLKQLADIGKSLANIFGPILSAALSDLKYALEGIVSGARELAVIMRGVAQDMTRSRSGNTPRWWLAIAPSWLGGASSPEELAGSVGGRTRPAAPGGPTPRRELTPAGGQWEGFEQTFRRIQSLGVTTDIPNQQLAEQRRTNEILNRVLQMMGMRPESVFASTIAAGMGVQLVP